MGPTLDPSEENSRFTTVWLVDRHLPPSVARTFCGARHSGACYRMSSAEQISAAVEVVGGGGWRSKIRL